MRSASLLAALALAVGACQPGTSDTPSASDRTAAAVDSAASPGRIVSLGGAVTETLYALGVGDAIVAVDGSSVWPAEAQQKAQVGYFRALSAEPILGQKPDVIVLDAGAGPPDALAQLQAAGVRLVRVGGGSTVDSVAANIQTIAAAVGRDARGRALADTLRAQVARAMARVPQGPRPRVVYVQGQGGGALALAGGGSHADALVTMAGGTNPFASVNGYKPLTSEALAGAAPDVLVATERTVAVAGGMDAFLARPGLAQTPAARARRLVVLDDRHLIFGPSLGEAVDALVRALHPDTTAAR